MTAAFVAESEIRSYLIAIPLCPAHFPGTCGISSVDEGDGLSISGCSSAGGVAIASASGAVTPVTAEAGRS